MNGGKGLVGGREALEKGTVLTPGATCTLSENTACVEALGADRKLLNCHLTGDAQLKILINVQRTKEISVPKLGMSNQKAL